MQVTYTKGQCPLDVSVLHESCLCCMRATKRYNCLMTYQASLCRHEWLHCIRR